MTKGAALQAFFNRAIPISFEEMSITKEKLSELSDDEREELLNGGYMRFYAATSVPNDVILPYGTYELITSAWEGGEVGLTVNLWLYTTSEAVPNAKAEELSAAIGMGGKILKCDGGYIWIKRGSPWCQSLSDETSPSIKRRYLNVTAEYLTEN